MAAAGGKALPSVPLPAAAPAAADALSRGERLDGRSAEAFRPFFADTGVVGAAAGSSYVELGGGTKVMAAVYGPRPAERRAGFSDRGRLRVSAHVTPFAAAAAAATGGDARRRERQQGARLAAARLQDALEAAVRGGAFPKAQVDVRVSVLEADGGEEAAAVVAAALALADAGVEAADLAAACSVALVRGRLVLDPDGAESACADALLLCAALPATGGVTQLSVRGAFRSEGEQREAVELALGGCARLRDGMRRVLLAGAARAAEAAAAGAAAAAAAAAAAGAAGAAAAAAGG